MLHCTWGKYRTSDRSLTLKAFETLLRFFSNSKILEGKMQESEEPKRPSSKCGSFISKQLQAEKAITFFNSSRTSLDSVLNLFEKNKDDHEDIPALLEAYKSISEEYSSNPEEGKKFPLIVLEGLDGSGKSTVGKRLSKRLNAQLVSTPPKSVSHFRKKFDGHPYLHAPFYYFGNYFAALEVAKILQKQPVVMDRFWHSTTAFTLAQLKENYFEAMKSTKLPDKGSDVYEWPKDLLKPDVVILLDVSEEVRMQRISRRSAQTAQENLLASKMEFRKDVLQAYINMANPNVQRVDGDKEFGAVLREIDEKIKHLNFK